MTSQPDYRDTVFLPTTAFPMRGDLPKREPGLLARWDRTGLYERLRAESAGRPPFTLHDGPPYANGHLHIGTALNKILKDVVNRAHQMAGEDAHYVPGWDCHGLPIEWQIEEKYRKAGRDKDEVPILQFRAECRAFAEHWMQVQAQEFRRLGVEGDFAHRYSTMDKASEAAIADEIGTFLLNGELYRGLRPVMWSPVEKTALAEAEVEYHDHVSDTVFVRFPVRQGAPELHGASLVIWTTTPWTLPGNRALAVGAEIDYAVARVDGVAEGSLARPGEILVVALALLPQFCAEVGITTHHVLHVMKGTDLAAGTICAHPLDGRGYEFDVPVLLGDFVTTEQGTGIVHMAPGHGEDDFALCTRHGIKVPETVGDDGTYNAWVPLFAGIHVYKAADPVCAALIEAGALVARGKLTHSYPHSWRSKAPLIWRATPQWFIALDGPTRIRERALEAIAQSRFVPEAGRTRLASMVAQRPDWCISRQRAWGVPIPVFVERATGEPLRDPAVVERVAAAFREDGADAWYASPPERFLGNRDPALYEQVMDIVDVWFESGSTHAFVLEARGMPWPADLYLEGSDQHRGWFQSSLLEAVGSRGRAPFEAVLTHGFVLDEQGRKMSKSLGNVTAPQTVCDQYGADVLRLWVMTSDVTEDMRIGPEILKQQAELYRRLRNTLRWLLGSLAGWSEAEQVGYGEMPELERWVLHRLSRAGQARSRRRREPRLDRGGPADSCLLRERPLGVLLRCPQGRDLLRPAGQPAAPGGADGAGRAAPLPRYLARADAGVHGGGGVDGAVRGGGAASTCKSSRRCRPSGGTTRSRRSGRIRDAARTMHLGAGVRAHRQTDRLVAAGGAVASAPLWDLGLTRMPGPSLPSSQPCRSREQTVPAADDRAPDASSSTLAPGTKCARCWRVLPEVGTDPAHPALCLRCADAVESGLVCRAAA